MAINKIKKCLIIWPACCCCPLRLRNELEAQESGYKEMLAQLQTKHASEVTELKEQLLEAETMQATYEKEVTYLSNLCRLWQGWGVWDAKYFTR